MYKLEPETRVGKTYFLFEKEENTKVEIHV